MPWGCARIVSSRLASRFEELLGAALALCGGVRGQRLAQFIRLHVGDRVDGFAGYADFVMKMRAGGAAGRTDEADDVALADVLAGCDVQARHMAVTGLNVATMFQRDVETIAAEPFGLADDAVGRGVDRRADRAGQIDALGGAATADDRVITHAEFAAEADTLYGNARGDRNG